MKDQLDTLAELLAEIEWVAGFADVRSKDDSKVFARVNRGALRNIAERARSIAGNLRDNLPAIREQADEVERCAKVAEDEAQQTDWPSPVTAEFIAEAIRTQGTSHEQG